MATQRAAFTRIVLPDGSSVTSFGELPFRCGDLIQNGDVAEAPDLNGWRVCLRRVGEGGRCDAAGNWKSGTCMFLYVK